MKQLSLDLGLLDSPMIGTSYDSYWDEITSEENKDGGEHPLFQEKVDLKNKDEHFNSLPPDTPQKPKNPQTSTLSKYGNPGGGGLSEIVENYEAPGDECPPTIQVGDRIQLYCPFIPDHHPFGTVVLINGQQAFVRWEPHGGSHINIEFIKLAPQLEAPQEKVGGHDKIPGDGCPPTKNHAPQHGWIEEYLMIKGDNKYIYLRYVWREGKRKRKKYLGNVENPKARERVEMVKDAIALGKLPHEVVELISA